MGRAGTPPSRAVRVLEEDEQAALVAWARTQLRGWPEVRWLHHAANGLRLTRGVAKKAVAAGVVRGIPDLNQPSPRFDPGGLLRARLAAENLALPAACRCPGLAGAGLDLGGAVRYSALYIELKIRGGRLSPDQHACLAHLNGAGYLAVVAVGQDAARRLLLAYLQLPVSRREAA